MWQKARIKLNGRYPHYKDDENRELWVMGPPHEAMGKLWLACNIVQTNGELEGILPSVVELLPEFKEDVPIHTREELGIHANP